MSEIKVDTLTGKTTANDITVTVGATATMSLEQGLAKAWGHFEGDAATPVVEDGLNFASITDSGTGNYECNFISALANTTYATTLTTSQDRFSKTQGITTTAVGIDTKNTSVTLSDSDDVQFHLHGDLA